MTDYWVVAQDERSAAWRLATKDLVFWQYQDVQIASPGRAVLVLMLKDRLAGGVYAQSFSVFWYEAYLSRSRLGW